MLAPLMYAFFAVPLFRCSWLELLMYWIPMFAMQELSLRLISGNRTSTKWSGIYETSVMPHLLIPIVKEMLGISLSVFKVTDKSGTGSHHRKRDCRAGSVPDAAVPYFFIYLSGSGRSRYAFEPVFSAIFPQTS